MVRLPAGGLFVLFVLGTATCQVLDLDTDLVESSIREVRALPPPNFDLEAASTGDHDHYKKEGGGDHDLVGYVRTKDTKGDHGYQHFDSFHKKNGDAYGFETHTAFGKLQKGGDGGSHHESGGHKGEHGGSRGGHYKVADDEKEEGIATAGTEDVGYYHDDGDYSHASYGDDGGSYNEGPHSYSESYEYSEEGGDKY